MPRELLAHRRGRRAARADILSRDPVSGLATPPSIAAGGYAPSAAWLPAPSGRAPDSYLFVLSATHSTRGDHRVPQTWNSIRRSRFAFDLTSFFAHLLARYGLRWIKNDPLDTRCPARLQPVILNWGRCQTVSAKVSCPDFRPSITPLRHPNFDHQHRHLIYRARRPDRTLAMAMLSPLNMARYWRDSRSRADSCLASTFNSTPFLVQLFLPFVSFCSPRNATLWTSSLARAAPMPPVPYGVALRSHPSMLTHRPRTQCRN